MHITFNKKNYNNFPRKVNKDDAKELLRIIRRDKETTLETEKRAVVWAYDIQGLNMPEIARELGYRAKSYIHKIYHENKGGKS